MPPIDAAALDGRNDLPHPDARAPIASPDLSSVPHSVAPLMGPGSHRVNTRESFMNMGTRRTLPGEDSCVSRKETNAERLRRLRAEAVAAGLCLECRKRRPRTGVKTCDVCIERSAQRDERYRAAGLCVCGRRPRKGLKMCALCRGHGSSSQRRVRRRKRAEGTCTHHGCNAPAMLDRTMCGVHLALNAQRTEDLHAERLAQGLCIMCGVPNPEATWRCALCRSWIAITRSAA